MRGIFKIVLLFLLAFALSFGGVNLARLLGAVRPVPPNYLSVGDCELPCWYGVRPGRVSIARFEETLARANAEGAWMLSGRTWNYGGERVIGFRLNITPSYQLRLGDAIMIYGEPEYAIIASSASTIKGQRKVVTEIYLYWVEGGIVVNAIQPDGTLRISPEMPIRAIEMRQPPRKNEDPVVPLGTPRWRGFANETYYNYTEN